MLCITYSLFTTPSGCHGCRKTLCFSSFRCFCVQSFCSQGQPSFVSAAVALRKVKVSVFVFEKKREKNLPSVRRTTYRKMGNLLIPTFWRCIACDTDVEATLSFPSLFDIITSLTAAISVFDFCVNCYQVVTQRFTAHSLLMYLMKWSQVCWLHCSVFNCENEVTMHQVFCSNMEEIANSCYGVAGCVLICLSYSECVCLI